MDTVTRLIEEIEIAAPANAAWDAVRDFGRVHERVATGFVTDCRMDGPDARIVTFANGTSVRETLTGLDDAARRLGYAIVGQRFSHYEGTLQVAPAGEGCRLTWTVELAPPDFADYVAGQMKLAAPLIRARLEAGG
jgi:hypothetical protein